MKNVVYILQQIFSNQNLDVNIRWLAVLYIKNGIDRYWRKTAPKFVNLLILYRLCYSTCSIININEKFHFKYCCLHSLVKTKVNIWENSRALEGFHLLENSYKLCRGLHQVIKMGEHVLFLF